MPEYYIFLDINQYFTLVTTVKKKKAPRKATALHAVFARLTSQAKVVTQKDFAEKLKYNEVSVSRMLRGEKPLPIKFLKNLHNIFDINTNFLVSGKGPIYNSELMEVNEETGKVQEKIKELEKENAVLKQQIVDKDKIIKLMEDSHSQKRAV